MSGNLSYQIEHHLFPDIPARRYPEIAAEVREICEKYDLQYNTGSLPKQLGSVFAQDRQAGPAAAQGHEGRRRRRAYAAAGRRPARPSPCGWTPPRSAARCASGSA